MNKKSFSLIQSELSSGLCAAENEASGEAPDESQHGQDAIQNG